MRPDYYAEFLVDLFALKDFGYANSSIRPNNYFLPEPVSPGCIGSVNSVFYLVRDF